MYAVMRRRPLGLKSRSISILELGFTTSSIFLALHDNVLQDCSFAQDPATRSKGSGKIFSISRDKMRYTGRVGSWSTA